MACEMWRTKVEAYIDHELAPAEERELGTHLRSCAACAADVVDGLQMKRSLSAAGRRYEASSELRAKIAKSVSTKPHRTMSWQWIAAFVTVPLIAVIVLSVLVNSSIRRETAAGERVYGELADLHVAALASATPVDVVSSDRHTVKPWFEGKIPFSFNLPELQGSEFTLIGGRVTYLEQTAGAHLIFQLRKHRISVFIFPENTGQLPRLPAGTASSQSFHFESWTKDGLRYVAVGDMGPDDLARLSNLLRSAG